MDIFTSFRILSSGLKAQRTKMDVITSNLANVETTRTPEGGPYKRKSVVLASEPVTDSFGATLSAAVRAVKIDRIAEDGTTKMMYDPSHPDADDKGYVAKPNVNPIMEMADMITASRNYEACVTAFDATKNMALKTLEMGK
jgi:flagellar basal-body rod protein FlgC